MLQRSKIAARDDVKPAEKSDASGDHSEEEKPAIQLEPVAIQPLAKGLSLRMHHKATGGESGVLFATRECIQIGTPREGIWHFEMQTIEVGPGHAFLEGSECSRVELWQPEDDGKVKCCMSGSAQVSSRIYCWWSGLVRSCEQSAEQMLRSIDEDASKPKKMN